MAACDTKGASLMKRQIAKLLGMAAIIMPLGVLQPAAADPVGGTQTRSSVVGALSSRSYTVRCWAHEITRVTVRGDGDTDLDVFVYDSYGTLITSGEGYSDDEVVTFSPHVTGEFTIVIVNYGRVYNRFRVTA